MAIIFASAVSAYCLLWAMQEQALTRWLLRHFGVYIDGFFTVVVPIMFGTVSTDAFIATLCFGIFFTIFRKINAFPITKKSK